MKIEVRLAKLARLKSAAENRHIHIKAIAEETGLARNTVTDYWYDRVQRLDKRVLDALCQYLDCKLDELIVDADEESAIEMRVPYPTEFAVLG